MEEATLQSLLQRYEKEEDSIRKFLKEFPLFAEAFANADIEKVSRLLYAEITAKLQKLSPYFLKCEEGFVAKAQVQNIGKTTPAVQVLDRIINHTKAMPVGTYGLGSGVKASREELQSILEKDFGILKSLDALESELSQKLAVWFSENPSQAVQTVIQSLEKLESEIKSRSEIFKK